MSQLVVNYSKIETLVSEIDKVADYFGNRKETHAGNARRIGSVTDKRGNLALAVSELYSRNSEMVTKEENLTSFRTELVNFQSEAEQADQRVANRICNETSSFCYKTGIVMQATEAQSLWGDLCEGVSDICGTIKDFYEEYKEEIWAGITLVIDTALVALVAVGFSAMILAGGPIALLLATGFVFAQVAVNLAGSLRAMDYYCVGDKETARRYANLDLKDGFLAAGRAVGLEEESGIVYDGCNLAATIILLYAPATMLKNGIKNKVSKLLSGSADDVIVGRANFTGIGNPVEIAGKGITGRTIPNNITEQMAMHQVQSNPILNAKQLPFNMTDSRWLGSDGWVKMQSVVTDNNGIKTNIHYVYNIITGAFDDFKFK